VGNAVNVAADHQCESTDDRRISEEPLTFLAAGLCGGLLSFVDGRKIRKEIE
jgi:hypothetical protein